MTRFVKFIFVFCMLFGVSVLYSGEWSQFRGDQSLNGFVTGHIPSRLNVVWTFQTKKEIKSSPVVKNNRIVIGGTDGFVYCLNLQGELLWKYETNNAIEAPALILANTVYIGNLSGDFYALNLINGEKKWKYSAENQIMGAANWWTDNKDTVILVGSYDFYLHGINANSGKSLWKYEAQDYINAAVAIEENFAVFGGCDGFLHVVDIKSGNGISKIEIADYVASSPALKNGKAFVGDYDGGLTSVDFINNEIIWSFKSDDRKLPFIGSPAISGNKIIIGNRDRYVYCLDKSTGKLIWKTNTGSRVDASLLAGKTRIIAANMRGDILILDIETGEIIQTYEIGSAVQGNPAIIGNKIIIGAADGNIYCFEAFSWLDIFRRRK